MTTADATRASFRFESLTGFFLAHPTQQEDPNYAVETHGDLGLIPQSYVGEATSEDQGLTNWQRFAKHVEHLNRTAPDGETYKVFFVTRHGQGYHNVMEAKVGTAAWESKWALLEGDGTVTWADAELTEQGVGEAEATGRVYKRLVEEEGMPWPALYCSPHRRCLKTACLTFEDLAAAHGRPFGPLIKENLRERTGRHTCDRRSPRSWIRAHYPQFRIEDGFAEEDELFTPTTRESDASHRARVQAALDDIFATEEDPFVSITMHSHAAMVLMHVIGHEPLRMSPAASMAFLVKATRTGS